MRHRAGSPLLGTVRPVAWGLGVTLPILGFVAAVATTPYRTPSLPLLGLLGVVLVSHLWGVLAGMGSAAAVWVLAIAYLSKNGQLFAFSFDDSVNLAVLGASTPAAALLVGFFKRQADRQEALLASQAELLELADEAILVRNLDGKITFWNDGAESLFGWTAEEAIGRSYPELLQPKGRTPPGEMLAALLREGRFAGEVEHVRKDGSRLVVESRQSLQLARGDTPSAILEISRDMSRRRQAEQQARDAENRFKALAEASFEGIAVCESGTILVANGPLAAMFGYEESEMIGMHISELVAPQSRPSLAERLRDGGGRALEADAVRRDGSTFPAEIQSKAAIFEGSRCMVVALRDISSRKEVEKIKDQVFGLVSHDLRNPMVAIWMALDAALDGVMGELPPRLEPLLGSAKERASRLLKLTEELLQAERMAAGLIELEIGPCRSTAVLESAADAVRAQAETAGTAIHLDGAEFEFEADEARLARVLENLLGNGIKFAPPGSNLYVSCRLDGDQAHFDVRDEGPGIPDDKLELIFERFQRLDASYGSRHDGHGLGLSICRTIVQLHGGRIWAERSPGGGSVFRFRIPLRQVLPPAGKLRAARTA